MTPEQIALYRAMLLDNNGVGKLTGGGGAADHGRAMRWAEFLKSQVGQLLASNPAAQKAAFEQRYNGGGFGMQYGEMPSESDMNRWMAKATGGATSRAPTAPISQVPSSATPRRGAAMSAISEQTNPSKPMAQQYKPSIIDMMLLSQANAFNERNDAVKKRETEIRKSKDDLYGRTMGRVDNWGKEQETRINEDSQQAIGDRLAYLTSKGLDSSTILAPAMKNEERERNRKLQALSEAKDDRAIKYDIPLTQNKEDFVERITDRGPSIQEIMAMAQQFGSSGLGGMLGLPGQAGAVAADTSITPTGRPQPRPLPQPAGPMMTPWGPVQRASFYPEGRQPVNTNFVPGNPSDPMSVLGGIQGTVNQFVPQPGMLGSNAYPIPSTPGSVATKLSARGKRLAALQASTNAARTRNTNRITRPDLTAEMLANPWLAKY